MKINSKTYSLLCWALIQWRYIISRINKTLEDLHVIDMHLVVDNLHDLVVGINVPFIRCTSSLYLLSYQIKCVEMKCMPKINYREHIHLPKNLYRLVRVLLRCSVIVLSLCAQFDSSRASVIAAKFLYFQ